MSKPRMFVASASESLHIAEAIHCNLDYVAEIVPWSAGFQPSSSALHDLLRDIDSYDYAVFVCTPDDVATMRKERVSIPRDNVILELGIFIGRLGQERCFVVTPRDIPVHLPTDLLGVTPATYDSCRTDRNWQAALVPACAHIKSRVQSLGQRATNMPQVFEPMAAERLEDRPPKAGVTVDQQVVKPINLSAAINEGYRYIAQTFTAGIAGLLTGVNLSVQSNRANSPKMHLPMYPLHVALYAVTNGFPTSPITSTVLATDHIELAEAIAFAPPVKQRAGEQLAIVVSYENAPPHGPGQCVGHWTGCTGANYERGVACHSHDGKTWFANGIGYALHFRTLVVADA
jgi:hypothetical protein